MDVPESGAGSSRAIGGHRSGSVEHRAPLSSCHENDAGEWFYRLRGLGEINDPNDFGQLMVCVIPLMFIFWRPKKMFSNIAFVILPVCVLLFGVYPHALARRAAGLDGDGDRGGAAAHWDGACAAVGGRAVRCGNGLALHRRTGYFSRIGRRPHGTLGRGAANAEVSSVVRSGLRKFAGLYRTIPRTTRSWSARQSLACSDCISGLCSCFRRCETLWRLLRRTKVSEGEPIVTEEATLSAAGKED